MTIPRLQRFMTAEQYLREYDPGTLALILETEDDPFIVFASDTVTAAAEARRVGEPSVHLPGENLPAFNRFVWALVYR